MPASAKAKGKVNTDTEALVSPELDKFIGRRATRRAVVEAVIAAPQAFTAHDLYGMLRTRHSVARATIYRTLRLLLEHRFLRETILRNGQRVYQRSDDPRTILWVCEDCSSVRTFSADKVVDMLRDLGEEVGLHPEEMRIEVHSRCDRLRLSGLCTEGQTKQ